MRIVGDASVADMDRSVATTEICVQFSPYVQHIARSWWRRFGFVHGHYGLEDIESAGRHGMVIAIRKWRSHFQKPLVHLASRWISEMCKAQAAHLSQGGCDLPPRVRKLCTDYRHLRRTAPAASLDALLKGSGARETTKRLIRYFGQSDTERGLSLAPTPLTDRISHPLIASLKAEQLPVPSAAEFSEDMETIKAILLTKCSPRQRLVFFFQFPNLPLSAEDVGAVSTKAGAVIDVAGLELTAQRATLCKIAEVLGLTRERVRQINVETMTKLRAGFPFDRPSFQSVGRLDD